MSETRSHATLHRSDRSRPPRGSLLPAVVALVIPLLVPVRGAAQQVTVDLSAGTTGGIGQTFTDPVTGLQVLGMWCNGEEATCTAANAVWSAANLWRSNDTGAGDVGVGVCDPNEGTLCSTGTANLPADTFFELGDFTAPEIVYLQLPTGYQWNSVTLTSLEGSGIVWADVDTNPTNGNAQFVTGYPGATAGTIDIPSGFASAPFLFLEPFDTTNGGSTNNNSLIHQVVLTNVSATTTTTAPRSTTTTTSPAVTTTTTTAPRPTTTTTTLPPAPCPQGLGFWKNHPAQWPLTSLTLGGQTYTQAELRTLLATPVQGDASLILADQLIAAKLNVANGSDPTSIRGAIANADSLLGGFTGKLPFAVAPSTAAGRPLTQVAGVLGQYNGGIFTPTCTPLAN